MATMAQRQQRTAHRGCSFGRLGALERNLSLHPDDPPARAICVPQPGGDCGEAGCVQSHPFWLSPCFLLLAAAVVLKLACMHA